MNKEIIKIQDIAPGVDPNQVSDGFHTFGELYEMRCALTAALFSVINDSGVSPSPVKSWRHSDGGLCFGGGWFIVFVELPWDLGQVSFHYPEKDWDKFDILEVERAPEWDGHSSEDVINRLLKV